MGLSGDAGIYQILILLREPRTIRVGALGEVRFAPGYYVYTGSMKRGLAHRLARHQARDKPLRWHADYLTTVAEVVATRAFRLSSEPDQECATHQRLARRPGVSEPVAGFGSSDCGCRSHLAYLGQHTAVWDGQDQPTRRRIGVTVLADYLLNEGVEPLLDNLIARCGCTAVATNPTVTAPAPVGVGSFQPPDDAGASVRLFDRPLWGQRALWLHSAASYHPNPAHYADSPYAPRRTSELTDRSGHVVGEFVRAAKARGLDVYFQVGAAQPPGLRDEDRPRLPNGELAARPMAAIGSLASEAIRAYNRAYAADLIEHYPEIDGLRIDWPEYPCYTIDEAFHDFSPHVERRFANASLSAAAIRASLQRSYERLHGGLTNADLERLIEHGEVGAHGLVLVGHSDPEAEEWLRRKQELSTDLIADWAAAAGPDHRVSANAFPPGYATLTGMDFGAVVHEAESVCPKLYTMHWSLMVEFWGRTLLDANPGLDERLLVRAITGAMGLGHEGETLADYGYPEPDERHPVPDEPQIAKLVAALQQSRFVAPVHALVHGYGPVDDFRRRVELVPRSGLPGLWVNRYGYLSDEKLDVIGDVARHGWST